MLSSHTKGEVTDMVVDNGTLSLQTLLAAKEHVVAVCIDTAETLVQPVP